MQGAAKCTKELHSLVKGWKIKTIFLHYPPQVFVSHSPGECSIPLIPPDLEAFGVVDVVDEAVVLGADRPESPNVSREARHLHIDVDCVGGLIQKVATAANAWITPCGEVSVATSGTENY